MNSTIVTLLFILLCIAPFSMLQAEEPNRAERAPLPPDRRERCMEILRTAIKFDEFWPAIHASEALTVAGAGNEVLATLRDRLAAEKDDQRRCGLAREMIRAGDRGRLPTLFEILGNPKSNGRAHAAESLYKVGEIGDGKLLRAAMEQKDDVPLQVYATAALAKSGDASALTQLREDLHSEDRRVRNTAAYALARIGGDADIKPLLIALDHETDLTGRCMLVDALACLGSAKGREEMGENLSSLDAGVRAISAEFVGHSRSVEFQAKLIRLLDDSKLDVRVRAAESLIVLSRAAEKQ